MKHLWRKPHRAAAFLSLAFAGALFTSCVTAPTTRTAPIDVPHISTWISSPAPERGSLIDAIPLSVETAAASLDLVKPEVLALRINVKPLEAAGFFKKLDSLKTAMKPVRSIRIHYWSEDSNGRSIKLSGMVYLPAGADATRIPAPLLLICHGTQVLRDRVPSRLQGGERPLALIAAATGVAVALPDYPGLGDGDGFHPYCHAQSLANAGVDMLRATRSLIALPEYSGMYGEAPSLFIGGYSEGGYAAMAAVKVLELELKGTFPLRAVFPMAGPFDMSTTMRLLMVEKNPIPAPYYLPYTVLGWASSYPDLKPTAVLKSEFLDAIMPIFDGRNAARPINDAIAKVERVEPGKAVAADMLTDEYKAALVNPENSPLGETLVSILRENDLYDWPCDPSVPMHFMATRNDELVPFENSRKAFEAMIARGARAELRELNQSGHENGAYESFGIMLLKMWDIVGT
jgi:acetyl esterase/lipase